MLGHLVCLKPGNMCKTCRFRSSCRHAECRPFLCSLFIPAVISIDSVSGQWRPLSDCVECLDLKTSFGIVRPIYHIVVFQNTWWSSKQCRSQIKNSWILICTTCIEILSEKSSMIFLKKLQYLTCLINSVDLLLQSLASAQLCLPLIQQFLDTSRDRKNGRLGHAKHLRNLIRAFTVCWENH